MRTEDLIKALVADNASVAPPIGRTLLLALLAGTMIAALFFLATIGVRGDFWWSIVNAPRFIFKFVLTLSLAAAGYVLVRQLARPEARPGALAWILAVPAVLLIASLLVEMGLIPSDHWPIYAIGVNAFNCVTLIPALSLAPLAGVLYALRQGAPANPALAGAIGGLLSAGIGATLYASHCVDDSPLFISIWYPIGIAIVAALGALIGARALKW